MRRFFQTARETLGLELGTRIYAYSAGIGIITGLAAVLFTCGLELVKYLCVEILAGHRQLHPEGAVRFDFSFAGTPSHGEHTWLLALLPALGGLIGGYLVHRFAREAAGAGTGDVIDAFHNRRGLVAPAVAPVKAAASILTLGSGGSGGVQGPMAQIGGSLGSWLGTRLKLSVPQRRILLLAGMAGGLGAIFRAPLGAAVTSVEVLYREDFESDALIPCVVSSIVAYSLYVAVFGFSHLFDIPDILFTDMRELAVYAVLGLVCAASGILYVGVFHTLRDRFFRRLRLPVYLVAGLGGLMVGLMSLLDHRILGGGFGVIQEGINGNLGIRVLVGLAVLKILATSCTVASGGSGGVFGPSLFIGGMFGGAVGLAGQHYFPDLVHEPAAYVVVGMASFFAGVANAPLAALIMVTEMTGTYHLLPPLMLVGAFAFVFTRRFSIYDTQLQSKFHSPAHLKDLTVDVLKNLTAGDVFARLEGTREAVVVNEMPYFSLAALSRKLGHVHFVVVDGAGSLRGMISLEELDLPEDEGLRNLVLVEDMLVASVQPIQATDDMHQALEKLLSSGYDKLPVVSGSMSGSMSGSGVGQFLGHMSYQDLLRAYAEEMKRLKEAEE